MELVAEKYWEFALFGDENYSKYYEKVRAKLKENTAIKSIFCKSNDNYLFAVESGQKQLLQNSLKNSIIDYVMNVEKPQFLKENLKSLSVLGSLEPIFLKVLCLFDTENDILEIEKQLRFEEQLYLKEFFYFKLTTLKKKWKTVCDMTNDNDFFFSSNALVFQLIRFLLKDAKRKEKELQLSLFNNMLTISKDETVLCQIDCTLWNKQVETMAVLCLIENLPQKIVVKNKKMFNKDFLGLLDLIFKNCLKMENIA